MVSLDISGHDALSALAKGLPKQVTAPLEWLQALKVVELFRALTRCPLVVGLLLGYASGAYLPL